MTRKTTEEIQGYEYDWLGYDAAGHVALFSTAGGGYVPPEFLDNTEAFDEAIEALLELPATTSAKSVQEVAEGLPNTWKDMAERGIFAFDSDAVGGPYRRAGSPVAPVEIDQLPERIAEVVRRIRVSKIRFESAQQITRADLGGDGSP